MATLHQQESPSDSSRFELASCQASLAFERTLITLDQSLMGAVRTSLALISFGFALVIFFHQFSGTMGTDLRVPARNFGLTLVVMGTGLVATGLLAHRKRYKDIRSRMGELHRRKLLMEGCPYRHSAIAVFALLLLFAGLLTMMGVLIRIEPFG